MTKGGLQNWPNPKKDRSPKQKSSRSKILVREKPQIHLWSSFFNLKSEISNRLTVRELQLGYCNWAIEKKHENPALIVLIEIYRRTKSETRSLRKRWNWQIDNKLQHLRCPSQARQESFANRLRSKARQHIYPHWLLDPHNY